MINQILQAYDFPKERSSYYDVFEGYGDHGSFNIDYFGIVNGVLQGDTLAPFFSMICVDYERQASRDLMKENGLTLKR